MLDSVLFYTYIIHLLIDAVFSVHEILTEPFNSYVERVSTSFLIVVHFLICSKRKIKWVDFACFYASSFNCDWKKS